MGSSSLAARFRSLGQVLIVALISTLLVVFPVAPQPSAKASGDPGWNSEIDFAAGMAGTSTQAAATPNGPFPELSETATWEFWIKPANLTGRQHILTKEQAFTFAINGGFYEWAFGSNASGTWTNPSWYPTSIPARSGVWQHVAFVKNGSVLEFYLDGQIAFSTSANIPSWLPIIANAPFQIGNRIGHTSERFTGQIDEVRVWNIARTSGEISSGMHARAPITGSLVGYWDFNEDEGTNTAYNRVGTANTNLSLTEITRSDVKQETTLADRDIVVTFPRTYLPGVGGWTTPSNVATVSYLVVGGGGAGAGRHGGGGGAGGFLTGTMSNVAQATYSIVVGTGGLGIPQFATEVSLIASGLRAGSGGNSSALGLTAIGGGAGAGWGGGLNTSGGSGGGESYFQGTPGSGTSGQGFSGGKGSGGTAESYFYAGGGGGGAGGAGLDATSSNQAGNSSSAGNGGPGTTSSITGTSVTYAAGGGGGASPGFSAGAGGSSIGGNGGSSTSGSITSGEDGDNQTGSGGGGAGFDDAFFTYRSGNGGSGVVILRYTPQNTITFVSFGSPISSITSNTGSSIAEPSDPTTSSEAVFLGWTTVQGDASTLVSWNYTLDQSVTLYGLWANSPGLNSVIDYALSTSGDVFASTSQTIIPAADGAAFTAEVWFKTEELAVSEYKALINQGQSSSGANTDRFFVGLFRPSLDQLMIHVGRHSSDAGIRNITVAGIVGAWTHIGVTVASNDEIKVYLNGNLIDTFFIANTKTNPGFSIGALSNGTLNFKGQLDQVKIWNRVLTNAELVTSMHSLGAAGISGLIAHFDFNESSGSVIHDRVAGLTLSATAGVQKKDVKLSHSTSAQTTIAFPRTYLPGVGGWTVPAGVTNISALIVAGGGGGGAWVGGGGGAGGFRETAASTNPASTISVIVGQGGTGAAYKSGQTNISNTSGQDSVFAGIPAKGGGAGSNYGDTGTRSAEVGGSGGGGSITFNGTDLGNGADPFDALFGNRGGNGLITGDGSQPHETGGGGGAGAPGGNAIAGRSGAGGVGSYSSLISTSLANTWGIGEVSSSGKVFFAGGGGGGMHGKAGSSYLASIGGFGGGGAGNSYSGSYTGSVIAQSGKANTGGGGAGSGNDAVNYSQGGSGGSGVIILSIPSAQVSSSNPVNQSALSTKTTSFSVNTAGSIGTLSYQWQVDSGSGFSNISGATSATYITPALAVSDSGKHYRVVVTSTINGTSDTFTSSAATLTVRNIFTEYLILDYQASDIESFDPTVYPNSVSDLAGNYDGILSGNSQVTLSNQSFTFDGAGGYIDVADIPATQTFSEGITIDFIADFGSADSWERIFDFGNGAVTRNIFVGREGVTSNLAFEVDSENNNAARVIFTNAIEAGLNRYTLTADGANIRLFTNGVLEETIASNRLPVAFSRPASFIGKSNWAGDSYFEGQIQHLRIFNAAFSSSQLDDFAVAYRNVSFDSNGGTSYSPVSTSGTLRLPSPAKVNSNFLGWFTSSNFVTPALGATYSPLASGSIYAQWIVPSFTLSLNSEGVVTTQTVQWGATASDPALTRANYTLVGWSDGNDSTAEYSPTLSDYVMGNANDTIYAVWRLNFTTISDGQCAVTVSNTVGATVTETDTGACLIKFTEPGANTFKVPANVTSVQALVVGAGGGGGAARIGDKGGAGGGGGGGAHQIISIQTTTSQEISLTVGAGGAGGSGTDGQNGGSSLLSYGNAYYSMSHTLSGGAGGKRPNSWPGGGGQGGTGAAGSTYQFSGASGGSGATDPGDRSYYQPRFGNSGRGFTFGGEFNCIGAGGGGGNREVASDPYFHWEPRSGYCFGTTTAAGGSGGYHNGTNAVLATSGIANSGSGGGGGSYDKEANIARAGADGADGYIAFYFTPATGEISLSSVAAMSYSATTETITLTKDNPTNNVSWTTSDTAVCTVSGTPTTGTVTVLSAGLCEVSVVIAAQSPYGRGVANTSFQIDKIVRPNAPAWANTSLSVPFGGTYDLWPNISSNSSNSYRVSISGTIGSCSVTGYTLNVGNVGDTCYLDLFQLGDSQFLEMQAGTPLSVTVTPISQSPLVITSGNQMSVNGSLTVSAAGGSGTGALSYHLVSDGGTGCQVNSSTGAITNTTAAGDCTVYAKRAASTNYDEVTSSNQVITVSKVNQVLQWLSQPQAQYTAGSTYVLSATASSQLVVSYQIASGLCSLASTTVTFNGSGDCVIEAYQNGDSAFNAAVTISQTVSVGKRNQTMTFSAIANKSWGSLAFSLSATVSSGLTIAYSENNQTTNDACDVTANGVVTIKNVGTCAITATQAGDVANTSVTKTQVFEVTANQAGAPFIGSVSFGDKSLTAAFFTPSYLGGGTVSAYQLTAHNSDGSVAATNSGCVAVAGANQTCTVIGLENGSSYYLRVAAITQAGLGELSASTSQVVPASNPEAVGNLTAVEGNGTLTLNWTEPTSFGGGSFFQYKIFWKAPGQTYPALNQAGIPGTRTAIVADQASTSYVITGLTNGVSYDVKIITATFTNNAELQSNTAEVNQTPYTVPDAPASVVALDNGSTVVIAWQPPTFDGGNPIDQYEVKKGSVTVCTITSVSTTSCEVAKPDPGTTNIEVRAGNDAGLSLPAQTTFVVQSVAGSTQVVAGSGGISLPGVTPIQTRPIVTAVSGSSMVSQNDLIRFVGTNLRLIDEVLIGGVAASFFVNSDNLITVRIPALATAGKVVVTLRGAYGTVFFSDLFEVTTSHQQVDERVTIGTFLGYAAVYTKNHEGKRLSMKIGNKWRVIESLGANYTYNLTKVGTGRTVTVQVYIDRVLVQVQQIKIQ